MDPQTQMMIQALQGGLPSPPEDANVGAKALPSVDPSLGIFAGLGAATANKDTLKKAVEMLAHGKGQQSVYKETGWFRNPVDFKWRFEIPDVGSKVSPSLPWYGYINEPETRRLNNKFGQPMSEVLQHPMLYEAYPHLKDTMVTEHSYNKGGGIYFNYPEHTSHPFNKVEFGPNTTKAVRSTLLHEAQHGVQHREGFGYGENYDVMKEQGRPRDYYRTSGEVEARNVERRAGYPPLTVLPPWETQDFDFSKQRYVEPPPFHDPATKTVIPSSNNVQEMLRILGGGGVGYGAPGQRMTDFW